MESGFNGYENLRLASSASNLSKGWIRTSWQLPDPVSAIYNDFAARVNRGDGGQSLRGQRSVTLIWNNLGPIDAWQLRKIVNDAIDGGGLIYATINLNWSADGAPGHWIDIKGTAIVPNPQQAENSLGSLHSQFTIQINAVETVNDPASL